VTSLHTAGDGAPTVESRAPDGAPRAERVPWWRAVRRGLPGVFVVLFLLVVASVAGWLPVQLMRVGSDSMAPTIPTGSVVAVERWSAPVQRMDVVALDPPDGRGPLLVKRVVAVGGDTVAVEDGVVVVNGTGVCEPTIDPSRIDGVYYGPLTVPDGELFLLGDNRATSVDSRVFGTVSEDSVEGHVAARLWPSPDGLPGPVSC
jgi:signal peptidase I